MKTEFIIKILFICSFLSLTSCKKLTKCDISEPPSLNVIDLKFTDKVTDEKVYLYFDSVMVLYPKYELSRLPFAVTTYFDSMVVELISKGKHDTIIVNYHAELVKKCDDWYVEIKQQNLSFSSFDSVNVKSVIGYGN